MRRCAKAVFISLFFFAGMCSYVSAQVLIQMDPSGKPTRVRDEAYNWSPPITVFSSPDLDIFVPDITSAKWLASHGKHFHETGTYPVSLYSYYKNESACKREMIPPGHSTDPKWVQVCSELRYKVQDLVVDTRKKTITISQTILLGSDASYRREYSFSANASFSYASPSGSAAKAVVNASAMVEKAVSHMGP